MSNEMMIKMQEMQEMIFALSFYKNGNIKKAITELKKIKIESFSDNCEDKEWVDFVGEKTGQLRIIIKLLHSKKIEKNKKDLIELGKYIQELGKEIEEHEIKKNDLKIKGVKE